MISDLGVVNSIVADANGWYEQPGATNAGPSYCGAEGTQDVKNATAPLFENRFSVPVLSSGSTIKTSDIKQSLTYTRPDGTIVTIGPVTTPKNSYFCNQVSNSKGNILYRTCFAFMEYNKWV